MDDKRIAIIRIHGKKGLRKEVKDTFNMLRLYKKHNCVITSNSKSFVGMIRKIDGYVTWGETNSDTLKLLLEKRGKLARKQRLDHKYIREKLKMSVEEFSNDVINFKKELKDLPGLKLFFKLNPPKGGFERGGIKKQFAVGGVNGYRKDNRILATGHSGSVKGLDHCDDIGCLITYTYDSEGNKQDKCVRTIHAELNCVAPMCSTWSLI